MPEPTVQVPVSLIERAQRLVVEAHKWGEVARGNGVGGVGNLDSILADIAALTPSADLDANWQSPSAVEGHAGTCNTQTIQGIGCDCKLSRPDLPAIEDMAPGTTFRAGYNAAAQYVMAQVPQRFTVIDPVNDYPLRDGWGRLANSGDIDPSTIRDVTPPREDS